MGQLKETTELSVKKRKDLDFKGTSGIWGRDRILWVCKRNKIPVTFHFARQSYVGEILAVDKRFHTVYFKATDDEGNKHIFELPARFNQYLEYPLYAQSIIEKIYEEEWSDEDTQ